MHIQSFTFNPFMTNGYVIHSAGEAALVDAPSHTPAEHRQVLDYIEQEGLAVQHLLLTHAHIDHIFGCAFFAEHFDMKWQMHAADVPFIERSKQQSEMFGVPLETPPAPGTLLEAGDTVTLGEATLNVLHTPGHSPGSICFANREDNVALSGDVLFQGSIGRVQGLPQTSLSQLMASIRETLLPLGDVVAIYPGHGPATTIGQEREQNPFLTGAVDLGV